MSKLYRLLIWVLALIFITLLIPKIASGQASQINDVFRQCELVEPVFDGNSVRIGKGSYFIELNVESYIDSVTVDREVPPAQLKIYTFINGKFTAISNLPNYSNQQICYVTRRTMYLKVVYSGEDSEINLMFHFDSEKTCK